MGARAVVSVVSPDGSSRSYQLPDAETIQLAFTNADGTVVTAFYDDRRGLLVSKLVQPAPASAVILRRVSLFTRATDGATDSRPV